MAKLDLKYGRTVIPLEYDAAQFEVLHQPVATEPLSDAAIGVRIDSPIGTPPLEDVVQPGETVLIVVPDATRQTASAQVVNLVVRRLIANGTNAFDIRTIFATGIHRKVTDAEKSDILSPFIAQRVRTLDHDARDLMQIVSRGSTERSIPIELNRALFEHDRVILIGGVSFHYFAGFTGGRKLVCPGLASTRTIAATHKLAFDREKMARTDGVDTARLDGNVVHEAFVEVTRCAAPSFAANAIVDDEGRLIDLYCGDWIGSHKVACDRFALDNTIELNEKRELVIASCGGFPFDINMIQAQKALQAASRACVEGGTIILLAECAEGTGRDDFLSWFTAKDSSELARRLCENYKVNGQTAWSLLRQTEKFDVRLITELNADWARQMRFVPVESLSEAIKAARASSGYILTNGAKINVRTA